MSQYLGDISAYALAVSQGYTGTEEEYAELMASYATVGQTAVDAKDAAVAANTAAQTAATTATTKASEATTAATTATTKAGEASTSASTATSAKDTAVSASQTATTKATEATTAAATATSAATTATTAKDDAVSAKTAAQTAQAGAETAAASVQSSAAQIATNTSDINELKEDLTTKADLDELYKAFPTDTASGSVASFADGANVPVKSLIVNIDHVQSGSGDPSPDNVRPISGWSVVNVGVSGKNLFDSNFSDYTKPYDYYIRPIKLESGKRYVIKAELVGTAVTGAVFGVTKKGDKYSEFVPYVVVASSGTVASFEFTVDGTFTSPKLIAYVSGQAKFDEVMSNYNITLDVKADQNPYEPYKGTFHTIPLGQTVYGGTLDVTKGELAIDHKGVDMGSMNWVLQGGEETQFQRFYSGGISTDVSRDDMDSGTMLDLISPIAKAGRNPVYARNEDNRMCALSSNGGFYIVCTAYTTAAEFKTAVTGMTLVYRLATPLTIQLTPNEVRSLLGANNVWADSGNSTVEYRADPTLYIGRLTEPDADMVADANIVSGQYFMVGNTLYKATANIASGATIVPSVNCTRKSLSEALNEINA